MRLFGIYRDLQKPVDGQVNPSSFPDMSGGNSPTMERWKVTWLTLAENPNQQPLVEVHAKVGASSDCVDMRLMNIPALHL